MTLRETIGELDGFRRKFGANSDEGFAASNMSEIVQAIPKADVAPNPPPNSTICAKTNLLTTSLPNATEHLVRVRLGF